MASGERDATICELKEMLKRMNILRENGYSLAEDMRSEILEWHSKLLQHKTDHDRKSRQQEAVAKAQATEIAKLAPKVTLMKLSGYSRYLSWIHQAKSILVGIQTEQAKISLIYQSLGQDKDCLHLKGVTSLNEIQKLWGLC
jgi:hypothetical protein